MQTSTPTSGLDAVLQSSDAASWFPLAVDHNLFNAVASGEGGQGGGASEGGGAAPAVAKGLFDLPPIATASTSSGPAPSTTSTTSSQQIEPTPPSLLADLQFATQRHPQSLPLPISGVASGPESGKFSTSSSSTDQRPAFATEHNSSFARGTGNAAGAQFWMAGNGEDWVAGGAAAAAAASAGVGASDKKEDSVAAAQAAERARLAGARLLFLGSGGGAANSLPPLNGVTTSPSTGLPPLPALYQQATLPSSSTSVAAQSQVGGEHDAEKMDTLAAVRGLLGIAGDSGSASSNASDVDAEGTPENEMSLSSNFLPPLPNMPLPKDWSNAFSNASHVNTVSSTITTRGADSHRKTSLPHLLAATTSLSYSPITNEGNLGDEDDDDDDDDDEDGDSTYVDGPIIPTSRGGRAGRGNKRQRSDSRDSTPAFPSPGTAHHQSLQQQHFSSQLPPFPLSNSQNLPLAASNPFNLNLPAPSHSNQNVNASNGAAPPRPRTTALPNKRRYRASTTSGTGNYRCLHPGPDGVPCPVSFRRSYDLARHKESKHREGGKGGKSNWICKGCGGEFARKDSLQRHALNKGHQAGV